MVKKELLRNIDAHSDIQSNCKIDSSKDGDARVPIA